MKITTAQTVAITGIIKNEEGNPVPSVLVQEKKSRLASAAYTDSLGFFRVQIDQYSKLSISCNGYNDTLVNVADKKKVLITLSKAKTVRHSNNASANADDNPLINKNLLQDAISTQSGVNNNYVYGGGIRNYTGSLLPVFTPKQETQGSRYLFNGWAHGSVINADNSLFDNPAYLYNYDKMEGTFLLTQDKLSAIEVNKAQLKSFIVYVDKDKPLVFESVPSIDNSLFVQVISSGNKYKIYKLTKTKFVKSDYHTDGIASTGNPYDEYIDENSYFVLNVQQNQLQKLSLKKKFIEKVFASEGEKIDKFLKNNNDTMNDIYLKNLGDYLNN